MVYTPRYSIVWLDSQLLNTPSGSSYLYSDGYPVAGPFIVWPGSPPSTQSVIIYGNPAVNSGKYWYYHDLNSDGWCNTVCQYGV